MEHVTTLPWLGILLAAIANFILGWFWYSPNFLGKAWQDSRDKNDDKPSVFALIGSFINSLVTAAVLACLLQSLGLHEIFKALSFSFWAWLGFVVTTEFSGVIWNSYPLKAFFIDIFCRLAGFIVMTIILLEWDALFR